MEDDIEVRFDQITQRHYYVNHTTLTTSWEDPRLPSRLTSAGASNLLHSSSSSSSLNTSHRIVDSLADSVGGSAATATDGLHSDVRFARHVVADDDILGGIDEAEISRQLQQLRSDRQKLVISRTQASSSSSMAITPVAAEALLPTPPLPPISTSSRPRSPILTLPPTSIQTRRRPLLSQSLDEIIATRAAAPPLETKEEDQLVATLPPAKKTRRAHPDEIDVDEQSMNEDLPSVSRDRRRVVVASHPVPVPRAPLPPPPPPPSRSLRRRSPSPPPLPPPSRQPMPHPDRLIGRRRTRQELEERDFKDECDSFEEDRRRNFSPPPPPPSRFQRRHSPPPPPPPPARHRVQRRRSPSYDSAMSFESRSVTPPSPRYPPPPRRRESTPSPPPIRNPYLRTRRASPPPPPPQPRGRPVYRSVTPPPFPSPIRGRSPIRRNFPPPPVNRVQSAPPPIVRFPDSRYAPKPQLGTGYQGALLVERSDGLKIVRDGCPSGDETRPFFCNLCEMDCVCWANWESHLIGKTHIKEEERKTREDYAKAKANDAGQQPAQPQPVPPLTHVPRPFSGADILPGTNFTITQVDEFLISIPPELLLEHGAFERFCREQYEEHPEVAWVDVTTSWLIMGAAEQEKRRKEQKLVRAWAYKIHNLEMRRKKITRQDDITAHWRGLDRKEQQEYYREGEKHFTQNDPLKKKPMC